MKTIAVLTSGGDSPGMNSSIRAVAERVLIIKLNVWNSKRFFWSN